MSKLTNVRGRISYISSHARQENLYAVYETVGRKFWSNLAKCNQEEFKKSGTKSIWPVDFGESWNSHIHAELRMKVVGVTDAILLYQPEKRTTTIEKMNEMLEQGNMIVNAIPNLSTFHLINGITEFRYRNWSSALTFLWIVVEEITDSLWFQNIIENVAGENAKKRKEMLRDTRTYTISVKQEILLQIGALDEKIYYNIFEIRQARNKLVHEGKLFSDSKAKLLFETVKELLMLASNMKIDLR